MKSIINSCVSVGKRRKFQPKTGTANALTTVKSMLLSVKVTITEEEKLEDATPIAYVVLDTINDHP